MSGQQVYNPFVGFFQSNLFYQPQNMLSYSSLKSAFEKNPILDAGILKIFKAIEGGDPYKEIFETQTYQTTDEWEALVKNEILKLGFGQKSYRINEDSLMLGLGFWKYLGFKNDLSELDRIAEQFVKSQRTGFRRFLPSFWAIYLLRLNEEHLNNIWVNKVVEGAGYPTPRIKGFSLALPFFKWENNEIFLQNCFQILSQFGNDLGYIGFIHQGFVQLGYKRQIDSRSLFKSIVEGLDDDFGIAESIATGLEKENSGEVFDIAVSYMKIPKTSEMGVRLFCTCNLVDVHRVDQILQLTGELPKDNVILQLPRLYIKILKEASLPEKKLRKVFDRLISLIETGEVQYHTRILHNLSFVSGFEKEKLEIYQRYIFHNNSDYQDINWDSIADLSFKSFEFASRFLEAWVINSQWKPTRIWEVFNSFLPALIQDHRRGIERLATLWLSNDIVNLQVAAAHILEGAYIKGIRLSLDESTIKQLDVSDRMFIANKLYAWINACEPLCLLPFDLLTERDGQNQFSEFLFTCSHEYVFFLYGGHVQAIWEKKLKNANATQIQILNRLLQKVKKTYEALDKLPELREFELPKDRKESCIRFIHKPIRNQIQESLLNDTSHLSLIANQFNVKYADSFFMKHGDTYSPETSMNEIGFSIPFPRGEVVDPVYIYLMQYNFRSYQRT